VIVDMLPHDREAFRVDMGHLWLGFGAEQLAEWLLAAGFECPRYTPLPADPAARGPALFAATARRGEASVRSSHSEGSRAEGSARRPRASLTPA
jgi:ArsR family transcriptional regulator